MKQTLLQYIPAASLALAASTLSAQTLNWGGLGTASLNDAAAWKEGTAPTSSTTLVFGQPSAGGVRTINNTAAIGTEFYLFRTAAAAYIFNGNGITLGAGGIETPFYGATFNFAITLGTEGRIHAVNTGSNRLTLNSQISGSYGLTKTGAGDVRLQTNAATYTGDTSINAGLFDLNLLNWLPYGDGKGNVNVAAGAVLGVRFSQNMNGLNGAGSINVLSAGRKILTVGNGNVAGSFSGVIGADTPFTNPSTGNVSTGFFEVVKVGSGTQAFTGANLYGGPTTVNGGTLQVDGSVGGGAVTVAEGATLAGSGTVGGNTTVNGNLAPGSSPGVLTFASNLTLAATAATTFEIGGLARGTEYDGVTLSSAAGVLTYGGSLLFNFTAPAAAGTYDLFSFTAAPTGTLAGASLGGLYSGALLDADLDGVWTGSTGGFDFSFSALTGDLTVGLAAIPEPSTYAMIAGVLALGGVIWQRRRARR